MIYQLAINPPEKLKNYAAVCIQMDNSPLDGFPVLSIDQNSYIVHADIQTGIDLHCAQGCHCIAIGKSCSLADDITFMIDLNHDYKSVVQGDPAFLAGVEHIDKISRKGTVIIQNDVWVGHGATIMAGVTLHNGCVVAAQAVVTKDVPPYAIVGGNPARILRYRFDQEVIAGLQKIAWWDWPEHLQRKYRMDFVLPAEEFVKKHLPQEDEISDIKSSAPFTDEEKSVVFFPADVGEPFPLYPQILTAYFKKDRPDAELIIYLPEELSGQDHIDAIENILKKFESRDSYVTFQAGITLDEEMLFQEADFYVTTRSRNTVHRTCLADRYGVKILYGTDSDVFPDKL